MQRYYKGEGIPLEQLEDDIRDIWKRIGSDPKLRTEAEKIKVNSELLSEDCPYTIERPAEGLGLIETFLVKVAAGVTVKYAIQGLDKLWDEIIWPWLEQRHGNLLKENTPTTDTDQDGNNDS